MATRREFTTGLGGAAAGLALGPAPGARVKPSVFGGIQVGVQSYTFRAFDIDRMITAMTSIGLSSVELWNGHLEPMKTTEATADPRARAVTWIASINSWTTSGSCWTPCAPITRISRSA